jgi:hypothetical protein
MLHGAAGNGLHPLKMLGNTLQHARHEKAGLGPAGNARNADEIRVSGW